METHIKKKKVLIMTDYALTKSGFGRACRATCEYLYEKDNYEIVNLAVGTVDVNLGDPMGRTPWKTIAAINVQNLENIKRQNDPKGWENIERMAGYGAFEVDRIVKQEKPDVFLAIQDIWGTDFCVERGWFNKIASSLWVTLDSLPILPKAIEIAPKIKNYWLWADFATQALHKMGHIHVKTVRGPIDCKPFFRFPDSKRSELRKRFGIPDNTFVIGFVFRNQLRKSVPNLLQGFKIFKNNNPKLQTKLLFHTSWFEGWNIEALMKENGIVKEDILTTYVCKACRFYHVKPFDGNDQKCPNCGTEKAFTTTHPSVGVSEEQLNEIYNLMNVYLHPFTSGGQEIPVEEAKLTELITLVTNYSCGEDLCQPEANSLPLDWNEYREPGTQFIKSSTYPSSIAKQLNKVLNMSEQSRREMGKKARQWVLDNFSIEVIGKFLEEFIDSAPFATDDCFIDPSQTPREPNHNVPIIEKDEEWLIYMYHNILKMTHVDKNDNGLKFWMGKLAEGAPRKDIENYFRNVAVKENQQNKQTQVTLNSFLNPNDKGRVLVALPESAGDIFLLTSLFKSIKNRYPEWALYVATKPEYKEVLDANPYVDKWLEFNSMMDNIIWLEGDCNNDGFFDVAYLPYWLTQRTMQYHHNSADRLDVDLKYV